MKKRLHSKALLLILLFVSGHPLLHAQDLGAIREAKPFKMSGNASINNTFYHAWGRDSRRDPHFWNLNVGINFRIYGIDIPFSANISKQNSDYTHPFNIYGISPRYKAVTLHLGYRSMQFSPYSLSGLTFLGVGTEIKPKNANWEVKTMYGRFDRDVPAYVLQSKKQVTPAYKRRGWGTMIGYGEKHRYELILFKAKDDVGSLDDSTALANKLQPKENLVLGFNTKHKLWERLDFSLVYSLSAMSNDLRVEKTTFDTYTYMNNLGSLYTPRASTIYSRALETSFNYNADIYSIGTTYRRIDPGYQSLGSPFINNDSEEYLLNGSINLMENKLSFSGNLGQQRNNLNQKQSTDTKRLIANLSTNIRLIKSTNISLSYSNFSSVSNPAAINVIDTVKFMQVTTNTTANISYNIDGENKKQTLSLNANYNEANDDYTTPSSKTKTSSFFTNYNLSYQVNFSPIKLNSGLGLMYAKNKTPQNSTKTVGPSLNVSKQLYKSKIRLSFSSSYANSFLDGNRNGAYFTNNLNISINITKKQKVRVGNTYLVRAATDPSAKNFREYRGNLTYSISF